MTWRRGREHRFSIHKLLTLLNRLMHAHTTNNVDAGHWALCHSAPWSGDTTRCCVSPLWRCMALPHAAEEDRSSRGGGPPHLARIVSRVLSSFPDYFDEDKYLFGPHTCLSARRRHCQNVLTEYGTMRIFKPPIAEGNKEDARHLSIAPTGRFCLHVSTSCR